jgi:hypothetical protein
MPRVLGATFWTGLGLCGIFVWMTGSVAALVPLGREDCGPCGRGQDLPRRRETPGINSILTQVLN